MFVSFDTYFVCILWETKDKETDMKSVLVKPWPVQPDIQSIQQEFQEIANANLEPEADLLEVASKFDKLQQQRNNKVRKESFPGLQEELQKIGWEEVPSSFQSIANRIEKDRGIVTEFTYKPTQILVCAAIQEMENFPVEKLDIDTLKKWGATLYKAKELGFQVGFAADLLKKNFFAYLAYTQQNSQNLFGIWVSIFSLFQLYAQVKQVDKDCAQR
ncbi:hypothetical protein V6Z12_A11G380800 [Gossypium hirsutum]